MKRKHVLIALTLTAGMILSTAAAFADQITFKDTKVDAWYYSYVSKLVDRGGISGYSDGTFRPEVTMTNAEFIRTVIGATMGEKKATGKHWASGYMDAAKDAELIVGDEIQEADWNKPITRQKMAVVIARTSEKVLKEEPIADTAAIQGKLKDYAQVCDYCKEYVLQAYGKGILSGYTDGTFGGEKTATRAEACSILTRMLEPATRSIEPEKTGDIKDILTDVAASLKELGYSKITKYVIADPKPYEMTLEENELGKYIKMKDPMRTCFVIDGKIVDDGGRYKSGDKYIIIYENRGKVIADIEKVDYIGSYNTLSDTLTLIPNPFKK